MRRTSDQLHHVLCTHAAIEAHRSTQCVLEVVSSMLFIQCNINSCCNNSFGQSGSVFSKTFLPLFVMLNYVAKLTTLCVLC